MLTPKFERATKTDEHYTGTINGRTYVVPHSFDDHGSTKAMRHAIVVALAHVTHNNPGLKPEEHARIHQHIKDIHGGQDYSHVPVENPKTFAKRHRFTLRGLYEERQLALHLGMTKSDKVTPEAPAAKKPARPVSTKSPEEKAAERAKYRNAALAKRAAALYDSRREATLAFARRKGIIKERTITFGSMKFNKIANTKPVTYNSFGKIVKEESMSSEKPEQIDELNQNTLKSYTRKAYGNIGFQSGMIAHLKTRKYKSPDLEKSTADQLKVHTRKEKNRGEGLDRALGKLGLEESEQLDELKFPNTGFLGAPAREIVSRVHDMGHHELKSLHKSYEKTPPKSVVQKQQHRSIQKALRKYGDPSGTHPDRVSKSKFVKKGLHEEEQLDDFYKTMSLGESSAEHINYTLAKAEHPKEYAADKKAKEDAAKKKVRMNWHKHGGKLFREAHLEESFMSTYKRNENANRHTANIVHLAKHFGDAADQAQAKFYAAELKKHGHNIHHEAQYKLHEKLFPKATAAHHLNEANTDKPPTSHHVKKLYRLNSINPKKYSKEYKKAYRAHADASEKTANRMWNRGDKWTEGVEQLEESYQVGDKVHLGFGQKGGAGYDGTVHKIEGDQVHVKIGTGAVFKGDRIVVGPRKHVTMKEEAEQIDELSDAAKQFVHHREEHWKHQKLNRHAQDRTAARYHSNEMQKHFHNMNASEKYRAHTGSYVSPPSRRLGGGNKQQDKEYVNESEQLDELKSTTLKKYIKGASQSLVTHAHISARAREHERNERAAGHPIAQDHFKKAAEKYEKKTNRRMVGVQRAAAQLEEEHSSTFNTVKRVLRGE